jgi:hypothetical protein
LPATPRTQAGPLSARRACFCPFGGRFLASRPGVGYDDGAVDGSEVGADVSPVGALDAAGDDVDGSSGTEMLVGTDIELGAGSLDSGGGAVVGPAD